MNRSMTDRLANVHPQMLRAESETDRKKLADPRLRVAQLVERALALMGITKQEAAFRLGYRDAGSISRWCTGSERPPFDRLLGLDGFEEAWLIALAERSPRVELETVVRIRRIA